MNNLNITEKKEDLIKENSQKKQTINLTQAKPKSSNRIQDYLSAYKNKLTTKKTGIINLQQYSKNLSKNSFNSSQTNNKTINKCISINNNNNNNKSTNPPFKRIFNSSLTNDYSRNENISNLSIKQNNPINSTHFKKLYEAESFNFENSSFINNSLNISNPVNRSVCDRTIKKAHIIIENKIAMGKRRNFQNQNLIKSLKSNNSNNSSKFII